MQHKNIIAASAIAGLLALSVSTANAGTADKDKMEKCYGIVKAGKNDCKTANGSCAGSAKADASGEAFIVLPKGSCEKIVGGMLQPKA